MRNHNPRLCRFCKRGFLAKGQRAFYCSVACLFADHARPGKNGCIEWQGYRNKYGYGRITWHGKISMTHRLAYELATGLKPDGFHVCHTCDNPSCITPEHLFLGTNADNVADKVAKDRQRKGEKAGMAKLTEQQVLEILSDSRTQMQIAAEYGIAQTTVSAIKTRRRWRHLTNPRR